MTNKSSWKNPTWNQCSNNKQYKQLLKKLNKQIIYLLNWTIWPDFSPTVSKISSGLTVVCFLSYCSCIIYSTTLTQRETKGKMVMLVKYGFKEKTLKQDAAKCFIIKDILMVGCARVNYLYSVAKLPKPYCQNVKMSTVKKPFSQTNGIMTPSRVVF